ncbi:MBL fold metallo-hydrolase [Polaromonas sp.]|uniref:MBL fold metallo-hydrolase n=1 Tax=Polaromonas sp. TaxID=1869339 RepID=UPI003266D946
MNKPDLPAGLLVFERGWLSANNILFAEGEETLLIDSGYCIHASQTLALVESTLGARQLDILINTHLHSDHCGGNAALQAQYPALRTLIPPGHAKQVACWDAAALTYLPTGQLCPPFKFTETILPGKFMRFGSTWWEVHAAPGHDPHSLIFFEPGTRTLISADALWENGFGVVFPELEGEDAFSEVAATLDLIESLSPLTLIPGHGRVFTYTPQVLGRARKRLEAFVSNPVKHARHAVKVLLKFKLLEVQRQPLDDFVRWASETPYFLQIRDKFFASEPLHDWIRQLCQELVAADVAKGEGGYMLNA